MGIRIARCKLYFICFRLVRVWRKQEKNERHRISRVSFVFGSQFPIPLLQPFKFWSIKITSPLKECRNKGFSLDPISWVVVEKLLDEIFSVPLWQTQSFNCSLVIVFNRYLFSNFLREYLLKYFLKLSHLIFSNNSSTFFNEVS